MNWHEGETIADFIRERLPLVLRSGRSNDQHQVEVIEEHQAEPLTDYYEYEKDAIVLIDGTPALNPAISQGELLIGVPEDVGGVLRGAVIAIKDRTGKLLAEANSSLGGCYPRRMRGRWVRRHEPIRRREIEALSATLVGDHPELARPEWQLVRGWKIEVIGLVFPDEVGWRQSGDGWVFFVRGEELKDPGRRKSRKYLAWAARAGREDLAARVPELGALAEKKISIVGLGGLGGPSALEFARAGVGELRILDGDTVDPGTAVRWPFGFPAAGLRKTDVISEFIRQHYPYVRIRTWYRRLGMVRSEPLSDLEVLDELLDGVGLLYDATAEVGIQHLLADLARERGIPYICVSSTAGAWGGLLIRIRPNETEGCWVCSQWAFKDDIIPMPPADPTGGLQPAGCADPTFTGAGFDLGPVAFAGVRLAVSTVSAGIAAAYPDVDWDVAVISLRDRGGKIIPPHWETFRLMRHPSCSCTSR